MSNQVEEFFQAFAEEAARNGHSSSSSKNVLNDILYELKRLNDNLESGIDNEPGPTQNIDAFLEEYQELRERYDESRITHINTDNAMNDAADAAREVRVQRTVEEEHLEALSNLRRRLNS